MKSNLFYFVIWCLIVCLSIIQLFRNAKNLLLYY